MAIVRSHTTWGARKSAGGVTYRQDRGRTIMSQKRGPQPKTRGDMVLLYREAIFAITTAAARVLAQSIDASFDKTRYGSRRNNFFKKNYKYFEQLGQAPIADAGGTFVAVLKSFGLETGQTIIAGLQQGILDVSAVEIAMKESESDGVYNFMAFAAWSENNTATASYVRLDIDGNYEIADAATPWNTVQDNLVIPNITSMIGATSGTGSSMNLNYISITGDNLQGLSAYKIYNDGNIELPGTWNDGYTRFTLSTPMRIPENQTRVIRIALSEKAKPIATTQVFGSGASGE